MSAPPRGWLAASAAAAVLFLALTAAVTTGAGSGVDTLVHERLRDFGAHDPVWLSAMHAVTHLGDTLTVVGIDIAAFVYCLLRRRRRAALFVAVTALLVWAVRVLVVNVVARPRPTDAFWPADGYAFPSGHSTNSATMLALVLVAVWPNLPTRSARINVTAFAAVVALAVGASRLAGGVHWPTDVLGGWLLATALVALAMGVVRPHGPHVDRRSPAASSQLRGAPSAAGEPRE